jgi:hypothetical protein
MSELRKLVVARCRDLASSGYPSSAAYRTDVRDLEHRQPSGAGELRELAVIPTAAGTWPAGGYSLQQRAARMPAGLGRALLNGV